MTGEIFEGLAAELHKIFGEEFLIYPDEVPQNLTPPCFLLSEVSVVQAPLLKQRQKKDRAYLIQYFPISELSAPQECRKTAEQMVDNLRVINAGRVKLRCTNIQYSVDREQRVLNFTLNINTIAQKPLEKETMEELRPEMAVKEA